MLQVFLYIQVFILGILAVLAARFAYHAYFKPSKHENGGTQQPSVSSFIDVELSPELKQKLLHNSEVEFQSVVKSSASHLQHELEASSSEISVLIKRLATDVVQNELERFHKQLQQLQKETEDEMGGVRSEIAKHQEELKAKLAADIEIEKKMLIKQIDTKLADAVASFLLDTLQHNVDLGNQNVYLVSMLEEHKKDFVSEVGQDEVRTTK